MLAFFGNVHAQHTLFIPDTLSGTSFNLDVHRDSIRLKTGRITQSLGINSYHYFGPTIILRKGDSVSLTVNNHIGDTTTMHWHGLHVAPSNDGGPQSMIMDGMDWTPRFVVRNRAATYWYHPHMMAKTAEQAMKGDVGLILVRDNEEAALTLPRRYGLDDFPIVVQSLELDTFNQFMPKGMKDSVVLVNGTDTPMVSMPAQVVRMRMLNGSGERTFNFGFTANKHFKIIANDNGLLRTPVDVTRIWLSPGERVEILIDLSGMQGQTIHLKSYASEIPMGVQGGPTMPMPPGSPDMNSPLNGVDFNILQINIGAQTASPVTTIPTSLVADTPLIASMANAHRTIHMTADSMMVMDGPFYFNGNTFDMMRIDYKIPLNNIEIWTLLDSTMVAHPFHLHDVHFYILDRNGVAPSPQEAGRKDVVLIKPNETVRFIAQFTDFADTTTPYMYHCHILMHEDDGMMGQFLVGDYPNKINQPSTMPLSIKPNPAGNELTIESDCFNGTQKPVVVVAQPDGRIVNVNTTFIDGRITVNTSDLCSGLYFVSVKSGSYTGTATFVKE